MEVPFWEGDIPTLGPIKCGGEIRIIAFVTEAASIRQILQHLGEPSAPPALAPARGPPLWQMVDAAVADIDARARHFDPQAQPAPEYDFDQRVAW